MIQIEQMTPKMTPEIQSRSSLISLIHGDKLYSFINYMFSYKCKYNYMQNFTHSSSGLSQYKASSHGFIKNTERRPEGKSLRILSLLPLPHPGVILQLN